ncbi:MAG TPA: ABC transporter permease [Candidatus Limnocylindrales bacterium]|nr:ABC transporter permease [Candidatus Limnocylindrales bacterium]
MNPLRAIWLVARRELIERGRSRAFLLGLILTQVFIVGGLLLQSTIADDENVLQVGYVGAPPPVFEEALHQAALQAGASVDVRSYPDLPSAEAALRDDEVGGVYVPGPDPDSPGTLIFKQQTDSRFAQVVSTAVATVKLSKAGIDLSPPAVVALEAVSGPDPTSLIIANVGVIFLFISIFSFGYWVLSGVVEEKQSRVVEVVLSTVRPRDLLMGKVLGIGILGLVQLAVLVTTGLVAANVLGRFTLPPTTTPALVMLVVWFVLGYTLYSTLFAVLGALASRMEEASNATMPIQFLAMGSYFVALLVVINDPSGTVARIASFFPPAAPMVVPMRTALGAIEPWEILLSIAVTIVFIYGLFVFGARVYSGAVLQTAGRIKLRDAWRSSR